MEKTEKIPVQTGEVKVEGKPEITQHELFNIVKGPKGYFLTVTNKIVSSRLFKSTDDAKRYIDSKPWDLLINVACICYDIMHEDQTETNKQ